MNKKSIEKSLSKLKQARKVKLVAATGKRMIAAKMAKKVTFGQFVFEQLKLLYAYESVTAKAPRKVVKRYAFELAFAWWRLTDLISRHGPVDDRLRVTPPLPLPRRADLIALRGAGARLARRLRAKDAKKDDVSIFAPSDAYVHIGFNAPDVSKPTLVDQPLAFQPYTPMAAKAKS